MESAKELKTGTTTVGLVCSDGVVLAAERKATMGYLVASKDARKILQVDKHIGMSIAGVVGDAQALERLIKAELRLYRLQEDKPITVNAAAHLVANILYSRRFYPYIVQLIIGGYDSKPGVYSLAPDGSVMEEKEFFSSGSGSPMALGVLEDSYKKGITVQEGKKLAARAVNSARKRDIASGGSGIDVAVIDPSGFRMVPDEEVKGYYQD